MFQRKLPLLLLILLVIFATPLYSSSPVLAQKQAPPTAAPQADSSTIYLPLIVRNIVPTLDLIADNIELTQAVQTASQTVPLVAGRKTALRFYAHTDQTSATPNVLISVRAERSGAELPGSLLILGPGTISPAWSRSNLSTSFNTYLPDGWLSGQVNLTVTLNPDRQIAETNESNNQTSLTAVFNTVPALNVTVVPLAFNGPDFRDYPAPSSAFVQDALYRLYPVPAVNVTRHADYPYADDLTTSQGWSYLLNTMESLRKTEHAPVSQVYYALIPGQDAAGHTWFYYSSGIMGLGNVGIRSAAGLAPSSVLSVDGAMIAAHEIGHNLGRRHTPCPAGVTGKDASYPYGNGATGQLGLDVLSAAFQLYPETNKDIMGYCTPYWISDYTYTGLYTNQKSFGLLSASQTPVPSLLIRALFNSDGSLKMLPVYAFDGLPTPPPAQSDYSLELVDAAGQVLARQPLALLEADEPGISVRSINTVIAQPEKPFSGIRLLYKSKQAAFKNLDAPTDTAAPQITPAGDQTLLRWDNPAELALVRYTTDNGQTWTTLGIDVRNGEFRLNPAALPLGAILFQITPADGLHTAFTLLWKNTSR